MDVYQYLLDTTLEYISRDEVVENDEIVSAYTLWDILNNKINYLKYIMNDNNKLLDEINYYYSEAFSNDMIKYSNITENFDFDLPFFGPCKFKKITSHIEDNTMIISLWPSGRANKDKHIDLCKDIDDCNYYGNNINDALITPFRNKFDKIFNTLEFFAPILKHETRFSQFMTNSTLNIIMNYPINGDLTLDIQLNKNIDPNDSQFKKYYKKEYTIHDLIMREKDDILRNTPIEIKKLNYLCSSLVKKYKENNNNKILQKK